MRCNICQKDFRLAEKVKLCGYVDRGFLGVMTIQHGHWIHEDCEVNQRDYSMEKGK